MIKILKTRLILENDNNNIDNINNNTQQNNAKNKTELNKITPKILSINYTKDIIQEIYNNISIYNQKCYENKIPRETLEQYMYNYLNQKYGLEKFNNRMVFFYYKFN